MSVAGHIDETERGEIITMLLQAGADPNARYLRHHTGEYITPLKMATFSPHPRSTVLQLLRAGAIPTDEDTKRQLVRLGIPVPTPKTP